MRRILGLASILLFTGAPASGYVDSCPTLGRILNESVRVAVVRVEKVNREKRLVYFQKVTDLKGESGALINHKLTEGRHPREAKLILDWAEPGKMAVFFQSTSASLLCLGSYWYECSPAREPWWTMTYGRPELALTYFGSVGRLREHVASMLVGREVIITAVDNRTSAGDFNNKKVIYTQALLVGKDFPLRRIKAGLKLAGEINDVQGKTPGFVVGPGAGGPDDVPALLTGLKSPQVSERLEAATELGWIGAGAKAAVPALTELLSAADLRLRTAAAGALVKIDPKLTAAVKVLTEALRAEGPVERECAAVLSAWGLAPAETVPALTRLLKDADADVRWSAVEALGRYQGGAKPAASEVAALLRDPDADVRAAAADASAWIGDRRAAVPALTAALADADGNVRWISAVALARIGGPGSEAAAPALAAALAKSDDWHCNYPIYRCLWSIGPAAAKAAVPALKAKLQPNGDGPSTWTLAALGSEAAVPHFRKMLDHKETAYRFLGVHYLGLIGPAAASAVPRLTELASDQNESLRFAAGWALEMIRKPGRERLPILMAVMRDKKLRDQNETIRTLSANLLGWMGPDAREAVPALESVLADKDEWRAGVREAAADALRKIGE